MWKNAGREEALVDQDYKDAATLAAMVAPYRHARLSAVKLAGDPNNPARFRDDATAARRSCATWVCWLEGGILDLEALAANSELAEALRIWGCANWCHAARRCIECQIVPAAISTEDPSNGPPHNYRRRIRQREQAQVAAAHFKCCRYRRRQNRCRPDLDLDPDLGQLLLGRRRPGLDPDLDRDLAVPDSYLWRGRRNFQPATLVSAKGGMFTEHRTDAVEQKPASDHTRRR